jgi:hypothetical protein
VGLTTARRKDILAPMLPKRSKLVVSCVLFLFLNARCTIAAQDVHPEALHRGMMAPEASTLQLIAPSHAPMTLAPSDIKSFPRVSVSIHNPHTNADEAYAGVRLSDLLAKMGAPLGSELRGKALSGYVIATGSDGYRVVFALAEIDPGFHPGEIIMADEMNGKPLDSHAGPFKIVATEDRRPSRWVRNLVSIELRMTE